MNRLVVSLLLVLALCGCQTPPGGQRWVRSEVYFGLTKPSGGVISPAEWEKFLAEVVTPEFPSGLSVFDASGQWRNVTGHIDHEASRVLVLLHPPGADIEAKIDRIRAAYCQRFAQEAVMKVTTEVHVEF